MWTKEQVKEYHRQYHIKNKEKIALKSKRWKENNKEKVREADRRSKIKNREKIREGNRKRNRLRSFSKLYNITENDYNKMFVEQNGCCAICNMHQSEFKRVLAIDHCHNTGKVRGLLCIKCNMCLGGVNDNIEILQKMIKYLKNSRNEG